MKRIYSASAEEICKIKRLFYHISMDDAYEDNPNHFFEYCGKYNQHFYRDEYKGLCIYICKDNGNITRIVCFRGDDLVLEYGFMTEQYLDYYKEEDLKLWDSTIHHRYDLIPSADIADIGIVKNE